MGKPSSFWKSKRVLISGHTGFKGSWLAQMLVDAGAQVSGYALAPNSEPNLYSVLGLKDHVSSHIADIRNLDKLEAAIHEEKAQIVLHLAAQPLVRASYDDPHYTFETNVMGTVNMLEAIRHQSSVKAAVMITTDKVYENPENGQAFVEGDALGGYDPYSASKAADEIVISSYIRSFFNPKTDSETIPLLASARAGNVIGGGDWSADRLVPDIVRAKKEGRSLVIRSPSAVRPWQHVLDPLWGYLLLAQRLYEGERTLVGAYNFAPSEKKTLTVEQIARRSKVKCDIQLDATKHEAQTLRLDAGKARKVLCWKPALDIEEGLDWTFDWYARHEKGEDMVAFTRKQIAQYAARQE